MSYPSIVLHAMQTEMWHTPEDLNITTNLRVADVKQALRLLERGMLVESEPPERFKRNKQYKTRQKELFRGVA
jgi:hypothetical protein